MRAHDEPWRPLVAGAVVGLAFLAKYSGVLLALVALLYATFSPQGRRWLRRPSFWLGGVVALGVALPVLVWNAQRGWPSLVLHFRERTGPTELPMLALNGFQVLLGQFAPFHPLVFPALLGVLVMCIRRSATDDRFRFLALASWPVLLFFWVMMARVRDPESHWTMVGYLPLAVGAGAWLDAQGPRFRPALHAYLAACVAVSVLGAVGLYAYSQAPGLRRLVPPQAYDPDRDLFNEMVGWDQVKAAVDQGRQCWGPTRWLPAAQYALCASSPRSMIARPSLPGAAARNSTSSVAAFPRRGSGAVHPRRPLHDDPATPLPRPRLPAAPDAHRGAGGEVMHTTSGRVGLPDRLSESHP
jgi:hypothetical protein